jgi:hypothetical protein
MRRPNFKRVALPALAGLLAALAPGTNPARAGDLQRTMESRWRGAWVLTAVDTYSDCAGFHTDNQVSGTLVNSKGRFRFRPGELAQVGKVDVKRSRIEILLSLPEPILTSFRDGPFTLYNDTRCLVELDVDLPRSIVSNDDANAVESALRPILGRFASQDDATQAKTWNRRQRDAYPADYDRTLAEHAAWKAKQANAGIQARLDKAMEETTRLSDRITGDPDYLKGFAAGVEAMKAIDLSRCNDLLSRDYSNFAAGASRVAAAVGGETANQYSRGFQDGQRLVFGLESLRRLPSCMVPVPEVPSDPPPRPRGN